MIETRLLCGRCGAEAPTREVLFRSLTGLLGGYEERVAGGHFCRPCVRASFRQETLRTLWAGWWSVGSLLLTPAVVVGNTLRFLRTWRMPGPPAGAAVPSLSPEEVERLCGVATELAVRLEAGEAGDALATEFGTRLGMTPGRVVLFLQWLVSTGRYDELRYAEHARKADPAQQPWW